MGKKRAHAEPEIESILNLMLFQSKDFHFNKKKEDPFHKFNFVFLSSYKSGDT